MQKFLSVSERGLFWLTILLFIFIPLYPKFPLVNVKGTFVAIRLEDVIIAVSLLWWSVYVILSKDVKKFIQDKLNQSLLIFFLIGAVSLFSAIFLTKTVTPNLGIFHFLRRVELIMLLPFVYTAIKTKKQIVTILATLSIVTFIINIYALGQQYLHWPVISTGNSEFSKGLILYLTPGARVNSTFAGHYDLAVFLVMVIVIIAALFFSFKKIFYQVWLLLLGGFSFLILVMTAARLSFVGVIVGVVVSLILTGKKLFILGIMVLVIAALAYPSQLQERLISTFTINIQKDGERYSASSEEQDERSKLNIPTLKMLTKPLAEEPEFSSTSAVSDITPGEPVDPTELGVYRSFSIRLEQEWPRAIRSLEKNPLLGTGYASLGLATDNDILRSLGEVGILGTFAFMLIIFEIGKRVYKNFRSKDKFLKYFSAGVLSMIVAFTLNALFIDVFEASKVASIFWMTLGLNLAIGKLEK